jgi:hypothetical protein
MRPLCGAIIAAGAFIGLGLTAISFGTRYAHFHYLNEQDQVVRLKLSDMDKPLVFILVFLTCAAIVGLGIAFVGLSYHHHKRHHELEEHLAAQRQRHQVPA